MEQRHGLGLHVYDIINLGSQSKIYQSQQQKNKRLKEREREREREREGLVKDS